MKKRLLFTLSFALLLSAFFCGSAFALSAISTDMSPSGSIEGVPYVILSPSQSFSLNLEALEPEGTITWYGEEVNYDSPNNVVQLLGSGTTGNRINITIDEFATSTYRSCIIRATDSGASSGNPESDSGGGVVPAAASVEYRYILQNPSYTGDIVLPQFSTTPEPTPIDDTPSTPVSSPDVPKEINIAKVTVVSDEIKQSDDIVQRLARNVSTDKSQIKFLTSADIDPSTPREPTQEMRAEMTQDNGQIAAKLNTITISQDGYYVFVVTVSDDLVGTSVNDLRFYGAEAQDFTAGGVKSAFGFMGIVNGITNGIEISNMFGVKLDTLPKQFLATLFLSASESFSVYVVKMLLMLLAGCDAGISIGLVGAGAAVVAFASWRICKWRKGKKDGK